MVLACHNIEKSFGEQTIVSNGSFHIEDREKAALVGINGAGKSTLLKMIMHEIEPDGGQIILSRDKSIGYLSQHQELETGNTILQEIETAKSDLIELEEQIRQTELQMKHLTGDDLNTALSSYHRMTEQFEQANGYAYRSELIGVLKGLGFEEHEFDKQVETLSGGQKTRVALGKLLITKPDILLLDEPTNHLDMNSIAWLETYLMNYAGAVLIVSHDRYFINRVVTKVIEIEQGVLTCYSGNYSDFSQKKQLVREAKLKEYYNQQQEIKHQEAVIAKLKSFNREKSVKRAESREKALSKIDVIEKPVYDTPEMHFTLEPSKLSGNDVLTVEHLKKSFPSLPLFDDLNFEIKRGEHVAIIGDNGTGKTTILKILNQVIHADAGTFTLGANVEIGYYDQEHHILHMEKSIFDEISDDYPALTNTQIRNTLAAFLFTGDDVYKRIADLSGGERGRVSLAKLMLSSANFLILDEPTNHLDIASKEILEQALNQYSGTVLYVSHDRYFINQTATCIYDLVNQSMVRYIGNYDYYLEKRDELTRIYTGISANETIGSGDAVHSQDSDSSNKLDWKAQKEQQALARKKANELARTEDRIAELESRDESIDEEMTHPEVFTNGQKCRELSEEKQEIAAELEILYARWEELAE